MALALAVLVSAIVGGFGAGFFATCLSAIIALLFYLPPYVALSVHAPLDVFLLGFFVVEGLIAAAAGGAINRSLVRDRGSARLNDADRRFMHRANALRRSVPTDGERPVEGLTKRELDVARLLARGLANDQIAGALFLSRNTVKTHLKNIYAKLGARTRTEAVARSIELGLLVAPEAPEVDSSVGPEPTGPVLSPPQIRRA